MGAVHKFCGKWWFWDEVWIDRMGPFSSREEAVDALKVYAESL